MELEDRRLCLTPKPSVKDFSRPFCDFVKDICQQHPAVPMFKVVPPADWKPSSLSKDQIDKCLIETPIKQNVVGSGGAFKCVLEEYRKLTVADMKRLATSDKYKPPPTGRNKDEWLERAFWSSVSINPPIYGADTPDSFFDEQLAYGWNLRNLQDLLSESDVPAIPGVTSPMVYFGMWKSFFSWHVEDVDLYSINYLHFGAPKVWYCVPPGPEREKFEHLARNIFPHDADKCKAFLRHKEFLISPKTLRSHGIKFVQAKQEAGEFIVLNAGAYHCGYNLGFNCAEAVNFATNDWIELGETASTCTCRALSDPVTLDMTLFRRASKRLKANRNIRETETPSPKESQLVQTSSGDLSSDDDTETDEELQDPPPRKRKRYVLCRSSDSPIPMEVGQKVKNLNELSARSPHRARKSVPRKMTLPHSCKQAEVQSNKGPQEKPAVGITRKPDSGRRSTTESPIPSAKVFKPVASHALAKLKAARGEGSRRLAGHKALSPEEAAPKRRRTTAAHPPRTPLDCHNAPVFSIDQGDANSPVQKAVQWMRSIFPSPSLASTTTSMEDSITSSRSETPVPEPDVYAVVGEDEKTKQKFFHVVQKTKRKVTKRDQVAVRWLKKESDGIYSTAMSQACQLFEAGYEGFKAELSPSFIFLCVAKENYGKGILVKPIKMELHGQT